MENNQGQNEKELKNDEIVQEVENKAVNNEERTFVEKKEEEKNKKTKKEKVKKSIARETMEWIGSFFIAFAAAVIIKYFIFTPTLVKQGSMTPTILDGERVLINKLVKTFNGEYKRGDIITFEQPVGVDFENGVAEYNPIDGFREFFTHEVLEVGKVSYIKRVIGIAGDHVYIENGEVFVNGENIEEPYLQDDVITPRKGEFYDIKVPEGYVFAMGDNREGSTDCRVFGCVPLNEIEGRVTYRIWPLKAFGKIDK